MQAILTGAGGQLAADLLLECSRRGHSVLRLTRQELDVTDDSGVRELLAARRPDWLINAAAYNLVDQAEYEPETAMRVNGLAVRSLARACAEAGATLLHYSTDYVFDGTKSTPYKEDDLPAPLSAYGVSKLAGEMFARSCCPAHYVLRVAGVYGPSGRHTRLGNFPEVVVAQCSQGLPVPVVADRIATPTFGPAVAARSLDILERRIPFGVYHLGGGEPVSWHQFARWIAAAAGLPDRISPVDSGTYKAAARRPRFSALANGKAEAAGIARMPGIRESLRRYFDLRGR